MGDKYNQSAANKTLKIAISFLLIGILYVLLTNFFIAKSDYQQYNHLELFKDFGFILLTLLFLFITRYKKQYASKNAAPLNNHLDNLTESESRYRYLFKSMTQGVIFQNRAGVIIEANDAALQILGLTFDQLCGKTSVNKDWRAIHKDGSDFIGETHPSMVALKTGLPVKDTIMGVFNPSENNYKWLQVNAIPIFNDKTKEPYKVFTTFNDISEKYTIEEAKNELFTKYKSIIETSNVAIAEVDHKGYYTYVNTAWEQLFGYSKEEVIGKTTDLLLPNGSSTNYFEEVKNEKLKFYNQLRKYITKSGDEIYCKLFVKAIYNNQGSLVSIIGIMIDVTENKKRERELIEKEQRYRSLIDESPNAIFINCENSLVLVNKKFIALMGATHEDELLGKSPFEIFHPSYHHLIKERIKSIKDIGNIAPVEEQIVTLKGAVIDVEVYASVFDLDGKKAIHVILNDITERNKISYELMKQNKFAEVMTEEQPAGIVVCDAEGQLVLLNKIAKEWHGADIAQLPQNEWADYYGLYDVDGVNELTIDEIPLLKAFQGNKIENLEIMIKIKGQDDRIVSCNGVSFNDDFGQKLGAVVVMNDITSYKNILNQLASSKDIIQSSLSEVSRSEFLLNEAGKMAKIGAWEFDLATQKTRWSNQVFELHGIPIGEVPDFDYIMRCYIDGSEEKLRKAVEECIIKGTSYELELRFQNARNKKLWIQAIGYPLFNTNNEIYGIRGVVQDITELKESTLKSNDYANRLKTTLESISDAFVSLDNNWCYTYMNKKAGEFFGKNPEELIGKNIWTEFPEGVGQPFYHTYFKAIETQEFQFMREYYPPYDLWFENRIYPSKEGLSIFFTDITETKKKEIEILEYQKSLQLMTTEISLIEEKQRRKIAENIHDHLSQSLVISKMKLKEFIKKNDLTANNNELNAVVNHLSDAIENSRKITYDLSPPVLYELGLIETMYWLADKLQNEQPLIVSFETNQEYIKLSDEDLILIYRTIQELITNILKHANATKVSVVFNIQSAYFEIEIADDGVGFDGNLINKFEKNKSGFGLFSIKERIRNLAGTINFDTEIGKGTRVKIVFPVSNKQIK